MLQLGDEPLLQLSLALVGIAASLLWLVLCHHGAVVLLCDDAKLFCQNAFTFNELFKCQQLLPIILILLLTKRDEFF